MFNDCLGHKVSMPKLPLQLNLCLCEGPGADSGLLLLGTVSALERHKEPGFMKVGGGGGESERLLGPKPHPKASLVYTWASVLPSTYGLHFLLTFSPCSQLELQTLVLTLGAMEGETEASSSSVEISALLSPLFASQSGEASIEKMTRCRAQSHYRSTVCLVFVDVIGPTSSTERH